MWMKDAEFIKNINFPKSRLKNLVEHLHNFIIEQLPSSSIPLIRQEVVQIGQILKPVNKLTVKAGGRYGTPVKILLKLFEVGEQSLSKTIGKIPQKNVITAASITKVDFNKLQDSYKTNLDEQEISKGNNIILDALQLIKYVSSCLIKTSSFIWNETVKILSNASDNTETNNHEIILKQSEVIFPDITKDIYDTANNSTLNTDLLMSLATADQPKNTLLSQANDYEAIEEVAGDNTYNEKFFEIYSM